MLRVSETFVNRTEGYSNGDSGQYEPYTDDIGRLFRDYQREYGRCTSKVYIDTPTGPKAIGWVFEKRVKYDDCNEYFMQEVWVTLYNKPDTVTRKRHYHFLS